jgi:hypothetical protein
MNPKLQQTTLEPPPLPSDSTPNKKSARAEKKTFTFDKSFWSHDPTSSHYCTQESIYDSFASEFLDHNFEGYNTCIFAYGQTGSGKSYTMMGTPEQVGLIPRYCEDLFQRIKDQPEENTTYNVHVSYLEIYKEHVRDLLVRKPTSGRPDELHYLKIRQSPEEGVYIQGLTDAPVKSFNDIQHLMEVGDQNRTTASTKMNLTSSRSHAVFTITLKQIQHSLTNDETIERTARMRLVDLAGSERATKTEAKGERLKEGSKINQSLTTLGRVIAALADPRRQALQGGGGGSGRNSPRPGSSHGRPRSMHLEVVPYRDSVLTYLLKDSLGGNSKTAMVACISPSASDYDETLSTLRYADQAKRIRTKAHANIDAVNAAERDAQITLMAETIRSLQLSVSRAHEKKQQEMEALDSYQEKVQRMQRLMDESRQVSEARIKALQQDIEIVRPENLKLKNENEALRRHLNLALGELKNPIQIPVEYALAATDPVSSVAAKSYGDLSPDFDDEDKENFGNNDDAYSKHQENFEEPVIHTDGDDDEAQDAWAREVQEQAQMFLQELGVFRKKVRQDKSRFGGIQKVRLSLAGIPAF